MLMVANIVGVLSVSMFLIGLVLIAFNFTDDDFSYREVSWFDQGDPKLCRLRWGKKVFLDSAILMVVLITILYKLSTLGIFF